MPGSRPPCVAGAGISPSATPLKAGQAQGSARPWRGGAGRPAHPALYGPSTACRARSASSAPRDLQSSSMHSRAGRHTCSARIPAGCGHRRRSRTCRSLLLPRTGRPPRRHCRTCSCPCARYTCPAPSCRSRLLRNNIDRRVRTGRHTDPAGRAVVVAVLVADHREIRTEPLGQLQCLPVLRVLLRHNR